MIIPTLFKNYNETKKGFEILLKYWEDKTKWYNKIF
jgi:hypothetical protein